MTVNLRPTGGGVIQAKWGGMMFPESGNSGYKGPEVEASRFPWEDVKEASVAGIGV